MNKLNEYMIYDELYEYMIREINIEKLYRIIM